MVLALQEIDEGWMRHLQSEDNTVTNTLSRVLHLMYAAIIPNQNFTHLISVPDPVHSPYKVLLQVLIRLLKTRLKVLLKVLTRLLKARLKVLLKVLTRLRKAVLKVLVEVLTRLLKDLVLDRACRTILLVVSMIPTVFYQKGTL